MPPLTSLKFAIFAAMAFICSLYAQERTAGGTLETQMTWSTLSTQIKAVSTKTDLVNSRVDQVVVCGKIGKVYAPSQAGADSNGCLAPAPTLPICPAGTTLTSDGTKLTCITPSSSITLPTCKAGEIVTSNGTKLVCAAPVPPSALNISDIVVTLCQRGGTWNVVATCPAGKHLLGCSGGPGDQDEKGESWRLMAEYKNERCVGTITKPMCDGAADQTYVQASCY